MFLWGTGDVDIKRTVCTDDHRGFTAFLITTNIALVIKSGSAKSDLRASGIWGAAALGLQL